MLTFTPGPLVTVGELGTGELETSEDPAFDSFLPNDVTIEESPESAPVFVEVFALILYLRTTLKFEYNTSAMGRYGYISGY